MLKMTSRNNHLFLFISFFFFVVFAKAQTTDIRIGEWKSHLSYQAGKYITQSDEAIIYATQWGIVYIDKIENSSRTLDKVSGLSNVGIDLIKYNQANDILLVAYSNSVIDLVKPDEIITLSDIQRFDNITGDKRIYDVFMDTDSTALLATGYGISKVNFKQDIFVFSTFTGVGINSVLAKDEFIYATTDEGIYRAINSPNTNLQDFGVWELLDEEEGFPPAYISGPIANFNNKLYVTVDSTLYSYENGNLDSLYSVQGDFNFDYMTTEGKDLVVGLECRVGTDLCKGSLIFMNTNESFSEIGPCVDRPLHAIQDETGFVWIADAFYRFRKYNVDGGWCDPGYTLNSPFASKNYDLEVHDGDLWVTAGGVTIQVKFQFWFEGIYSRQDGQWDFYNRLNRADLAGSLDFLRMAFHPEKEIMYASTYYDGLYKFENDEFELLIDTNSTLGNPFVGDPARTKVAGIEFDEDNNLWIANPGSTEPISVISDEGEMKSFSIATKTSATELFNLAIDDNGFKWFTVTEGTAGIVIFDEVGFDIPGDENIRVLTSSNSALPTNNVKAITKDLDGDMWVGTTDGIIIFECGSAAFDEGQCQGTRKIVEQDGIPAYLLVGEDVQTIAVDGGNRKWVGTTNGVFVLSPNGEELIAKFDTENSPLFDNLITDIAIDNNSGEVYIGTAEGIISYRSEATEGGVVHQSKALVYPNPVRPDYVGPIAIKGLARDSNVKITDINGQLVFETTAIGGQAIWDGMDYTGRKAASGVYLVFGTTSRSFEEPQAMVAKILFVN